MKNRYLGIIVFPVVAVVEASKKLNLTDEAYAKVIAVLKEKLPNLKEGQEGFAPI